MTKLNQRVGDWMLGLAYDDRLNEQQDMEVRVDRRLLDPRPLRIAFRALPVSYGGMDVVDGEQLGNGIALMRKHRLLDWVTDGNNKRNLQHAVMGCVERTIMFDSVVHNDDHFELAKGTLRCDNGTLYCISEWNGEAQQFLDLSWAWKKPEWTAMCWMTKLLCRNGIMDFPLEHLSDRLHDMHFELMQENPEQAAEMKKEEWMQPGFRDRLSQVWKKRSAASVERTLPKGLVPRFREINRAFKEYTDFMDKFPRIDTTDGDVIEEAAMHPVVWSDNCAVMNEEIDSDIDNYYSNYIILGSWREVSILPEGIELLDRSDRFIQHHHIRHLVLTWLNDLRELSYRHRTSAKA